MTTDKDAILQAVRATITEHLSEIIDLEWEGWDGEIHAGGYVVHISLDVTREDAK